jgi:hypothetical protein
MELALHAGAARPVSRAALWTGRVLGGIAVLFLLFSATVKLLRAPQALESFEQLGYPPSVALGIGLVELACTLLYLWPRTSFAGAVLLTGYLGGAVATHLRLLDPWLTHTLFPLYVGALAWGGLALRDRRVLGLLGARPER